MLTFLLRWILLLLLNTLAGTVAMVCVFRMHRWGEEQLDLVVSWLTLSLGLVIGLQLLLGVLGLLYPWAELASLLLLALGSYLVICRGLRPRMARALARVPTFLRDQFERLGSGELSAVSLAILCFTCAIAIGALAEPSTMFDTLAYHMPMVVEWSQSAHLTTFYLPMADYANSYFPGNGQLLYLWTFNVLKSDLLVNFTNLGLWGLTGLALAFALRAVGAGHAIVLALPQILLLTPVALSQAIDQSLDLAGTAFFLLALGYLMEFRRSHRSWHVTLFGVALGCLLGTKYSGPAYAMILVVLFLVILGDQRRWRSAETISIQICIVMALTVSLGGFWYIRNFAHTGNPLYPMRLSMLGHTVFPGPSNDRWRMITLWNYIGDPQVLRMTAVAFVSSFGVVVAFVFLAAATVTAYRLVARPSPVPREPALRRSLLMCIICGVLSSILYLRTPYSVMRFASSSAISTTMLSEGMRFGLTGVALWLLVIGLGFHSLGVTTTRQRNEMLLVPALLQAIVVAYDRGAASFFARRLFSYHQLLVAMAFAGTLLLVVYVAARPSESRARGRLSRHRLVSVLALLGLLSGTSAYVVEQYRNAYRISVYRREYGEIADGWAWIREHVSSSRLAYAGSLLTYPLYGQEFTNRVRYVNIAGELDWRYHDFASRGRYYRGDEAAYDDWVRNLVTWGTDYLVVSGEGDLLEATWATQHREAFELVYSAGPLSVYRTSTRP